MDPLANLERQRELAAEIVALLDKCEDDDGLYESERAEKAAGLANELAELVRALDNWRRGGGFDPYAATAN